MSNNNSLRNKLKAMPMGIRILVFSNLFGIALILVTFFSNPFSQLSLPDYANWGIPPSLVNFWNFVNLLVRTIFIYSAFTKYYKGWLVYMGWSTLIVVMETSSFVQSLLASDVPKDYSTLDIYATSLGIFISIYILYYLFKKRRYFSK